jgi:septal ring factor EnvC (AmiA/AmiB activator)
MAKSLPFSRELNSCAVNATWFSPPAVAHREELGRRLVEQEAAVQQLSASNEQLQAKIHELTTAKQRLELALTAAKSSVAAQEQVVASMLQRFSATVPSLDVAAKYPIDGAEKSVKRDEKTPAVTRT